MREEVAQWFCSNHRNMISLMENNTALNGIGNIVKPRVLCWYVYAVSKLFQVADTRGDELPGFAKDADLVLAADCVYLESAFPLLEKTLLDLTENGTLILMAYKKRRKADARFFKAMRKNFVIDQVSRTGRDRWWS
jgi:hypothetical protein